MALYSVARDLLGASAVENCCQCHFFSLSQPAQLVVASRNIIRVYHLRQQDVGQRCKLEQAAEFTFMGTIQAIASAKLPNATRESLFLAFDEAKLSVVEYDAATHGLKTLSMHYFESDAIREGHTQTTCRPMVKVDPSNRFAVMTMYDNRLVVVPFARDDPSAQETMDGKPINAGATELNATESRLQSHVVDCRTLSPAVKRILHIEWLLGYHVPTLLILHETAPSFPGRLAVTKDTRAIVALSLSDSDHQHPVVWSMGGLPSDLHKALAVPPPLGGVLLFGTNCLVHLSQATPPFAVAVNSLAHNTTNYKLREQEFEENRVIALDCSNATFVAPLQAIVSLRSGTIYLITLCSTDGRNVQQFKFSRLANSVLSSCICGVGQNFLFFGSRLGNSLLLHYAEQQAEQAPAQDDQALEHRDKRMRLESADGAAAAAVASAAAEVDLEDLQVYGDSLSGNQTVSSAAATATSYRLSACDNLLNVGPITAAALGPPAELLDDFNDNALELVTCSGYGKNGAVCVLQRSVRPQVFMSTDQLEGIVGAWALHSAAKEGQGSEFDSFIILSRKSSSLVLSTGSGGLQEIEHSGFQTDAMTIAAGNLCKRKYIVQVSPLGVRLLQDQQQVQHVAVPTDVEIVSCSIADPFVLLLMSNGTLMLLTAHDTEGQLDVSIPHFGTEEAVEAISLFVDDDHVFDVYEPSQDAFVETDAGPSASVPTDMSTSANDILDDEDAMLYGDDEFEATKSAHATAGAKGAAAAKATMAGNNATAGDTPEKAGSGSKERHIWCALCLQNGTMEIFQLPDFTLRYTAHNVAMGPMLLSDSVQTVSTGMERTASRPDNSAEASTKNEDPAVTEISLVSLGQRVYLLAVTELSLLVYEAFPFQRDISTAADAKLWRGRLAMRFRKVEHDVVLHTLQSLAKVGQSKPEDDQASSSKSKREKKKKRRSQVVKRRERVLHPFRNIGEMSGVFIASDQPSWFMMGPLKALRTHPMPLDSAAVFSPFHTANCLHGFIFFNKQGVMRICGLPFGVTYDAPWLVKKVALRKTALFLDYHMETGVYPIVLVDQVKAIYPPLLDNEDPSDPPVPMSRDGRFVYPTEDRHTVHLMSPASWDIVPKTSVEIEAGQHISAFAVVSLKSQENRRGFKSMIAVGTTKIMGEEVAARGYVMLMEVLDVVPEEGQPLTKNKIKQLCKLDLRGAVTAMGDVQGYLTGCVSQRDGAKVYVWNVRDQTTLIGIAFCDSMLHTRQLRSVKNYILCSDAYQSISVLRFNDLSKTVRSDSGQRTIKVRATLTRVTRDTALRMAVTSDFMVDKQELGFSCVDEKSNFFSFCYAPEDPETEGGRHLFKRGDYHLGLAASVMFRLRCPDVVGEDGSVRPADRHVTCFGSLEGAIGTILPVPEAVYKRLLMLQARMTVGLQHHAGLNPKAYRAARGERQLSRNVLDGSLLFYFRFLSVIEQREFARRCGTTSKQIFEDLCQIQQATTIL
eukprot:m.157284 g.157284  ORF g.157284 m.157284 type:complete len:1480 (-) comp17579_c0_seq5:122-4561(-)